MTSQNYFDEENRQSRQIGKLSAKNHYKRANKVKVREQNKPNSRATLLMIYYH
jgi:hypothetical protein